MSVKGKWTNKDTFEFEEKTCGIPCMGKVTLIDDRVYVATHNPVTFTPKQARKFARAIIKNANKIGD
jgi:hypothetical protein